MRPIAHIYHDHELHSSIEEPLLAAGEGHLDQVAALAAAWCADMIPPDKAKVRESARQIGILLGFWHDLGKFSRQFQAYLRQASAGDPHAMELRGRVDHATAGGQHAVRRLGDIIGLLLAFPIVGHHSGLPDWLDNDRSSLKARLARQDLPEWLPFVPAELLNLPGPTLPLPCSFKGFAIAFFIRMAFSCLKDADFLATEGFMNPAQARQRVAPSVTMAAMAEHLERYLRQRFPTPRTPVERWRQVVLDRCLQEACQPPGFFSLNVPTGGGKTLASLAFALRHASHHQQRRVICAIPFTSIIEQNAQVYRQAFAEWGDHIVLEHHANLEPADPDHPAARLAAENWDAPLIVTTNVQFFESLFSNRTSRCRKLHRMARSVIILDEAQALPTRLLTPCLAALKELVATYGCTVVLATATQPALHHRETFKIGLQGVREIIEDPATLHAHLKRVAVSHAGALSLTDLAQRMAEAHQVLTIVNTRAHAHQLFRCLRDMVPAGGFHLSALMCPKHRQQVLADIRQRLQAQQPCRLVATQLVEAGVDLDFPVVYRAMAGLDALAQAAGRCNREGRLPALGQTLVFTPAEPAFFPTHDLGLAAGHGREIMELSEYQNDFLSMAAIEHYFRLHFWDRGGENGQGWDKAQIMDCFQLGSNPKELFPFQFKKAAAGFRLIEDDQLPVVIPWDEHAQTLIDRLRALRQPPPGLLADAGRQLQRYLVTVPPYAMKALVLTGKVETLHERFCILLQPQQDYDEHMGLSIPQGDRQDPASLIC